jgi:outer membrane protein OmpA-like peptidoglycan-associated protein
MRSRLRLTSVALAALLAAQGVSAEPIGRHIEVAPFGGFVLFDGDLRYPGTAPLTDDLYVGGRLGYQWNPWLGFEAAGGLVPTAEDVDGGRDMDFWHASGNVVITPWARRWGGPFVFGGFGTGELSATSGGVTPADPQFGDATDGLTMNFAEFGAGLRLWMTDALGLRFEARNLTWIRDESDKDPFQHMLLGGGLTFAFGGTPRDTDGDGVPDKKDQCPGTPAGAKVDENGCPIDSDGDKVFDGLDQCPNTPTGATVDARGCPSDQDGDGVFDGIDQCADTPKGATVDARGCPGDTDGDGVLNGLDACENTPKGATVDERGCPKDSDGDTVLDGLDKCPDTPAGLKVDADGCPILVTEKETELLDTGMIQLSDVNFETGKSDILPESFAVLDAVGTLLGRWPELKIEIGGHTDSRGSNATNQKLSDSRAKAVLAYLLGKFPELKAEQFTAKGYGESKPLVPNNSDLNMAKNRRVEFVVQNKDVLRRETERRRLLQQDGATAPDTTTPAPADTTRR